MAGIALSVQKSGLKDAKIKQGKLKIEKTMRIKEFALSLQTINTSSKPVGILSARSLMLAVCLITGCCAANAQRDNGEFDYNDGHHEFRLGGSDGLTLTTVSFWGMGLDDVLNGTTRSDITSTGVLGIGYRYGINRFRVGLDFGFTQLSSKITKDGETAPYIKENEMDFLVLPAAEMIYLKKGLFELYGSVAVGVDVSRYSEKGLTSEGSKATLPRSEVSTNFAFHVNPIALRVGNNSIGGFLEVGLGYKGFVTAGVSMRI